MTATREATPGFNTFIPPSIMTPDTVETRIGTLQFADGLPTPETVRTVEDNLDFMRGVDVFLRCIPPASLEGMRRGNVEMGVDACHKVLIADELLDSDPLFLTGNTDTVYCSGFLDMERDGPTVVEVPPNCGPGTVNDAWFRFVIDMGAPGPDRGQGGTYLVVPEGWEGEVPEGWHLAITPSRINWLILRGLLVDGKPEAPTKMFQEGLRIYPYSQRDAPPTMEFISMSRGQVNTIHANDASYFEEVASVIRREPLGLIDPEVRGTLASIGIRADRDFAPDERLREILVESAAVGNATARAITFVPRDPDARIWSDRKWNTGFVGGDNRWLNGDGVGGLNLDARTLFFYMATVNTPAMALRIPGVGSQYAIVSVDTTNAYLKGDRTYRLRLPAGAPAKNFWSVVAYDPQSRSELQTGQPFPSRNSVRDEMTYNDDGSIDIVFGPEEPTELAANWIQTIPGKGWFTILRMYGPLEPWFDKSWRPGDIEAT